MARKCHHMMEENVVQVLFVFWVNIYIIAIVLV